MSICTCHKTATQASSIIVTVCFRLRVLKLGDSMPRVRSSTTINTNIYLKGAYITPVE